MSRKRVDSGREVELGIGVFSASPIQPKSSKNATSSLKERYQSIGLIAMVLCFIIIGFQMTTNDAYSKKSDNIISVNAQTDTPSPTNHQIEVMIHEDDGDVEIDVPDQLPPDLPDNFNQNFNPNLVPNPDQFITSQSANTNNNNQQQSQSQPGTSLTIRRTQTNNNESSSLSSLNILITKKHVTNQNKHL